MKERERAHATKSNVRWLVGRRRRGDGAVPRGEHVLPLLRRREGGGEGGGPELLTSKDLAALVCVSEGSENGPRCRSKARVKICWPDIVTL